MKGGKREGAGRKRKLDAFERMILGSQCEKRFSQLWEEAREKHWRERLGMAELHALQAEGQAAAVAGRGVFSNSIEGREHAELVDQAIRNVRKTPDFVEVVSRIFSRPAPRPKGVKAAICRAVAEEYGAKWALTDLGPRYVQRCWDEYRAVERETRP